MNLNHDDSLPQDISENTRIAIEEARHPRWYRSMFAAWVGFGICLALLALGFGGCLYVAGK